MAEQIITPDMTAELTHAFTHLKDEITLLVFTEKGVNDQFNDFAVRFVKELSNKPWKIQYPLHGRSTWRGGPLVGNGYNHGFHRTEYHLGRFEKEAPEA
jgi:hypothetical protein